MENRGLREFIESLQQSRANMAGPNRRRNESPMTNNVDTAFLNMIRRSLEPQRGESSRRRRRDDDDEEEAMISVRPSHPFRTCGFDPDREEREYGRGRFGRSRNNYSPERRTTVPPPTPTFKLRNCPYMNIERIFDRSERAQSDRG